MNVDWLQSFVAASRERSLLQASEKLHISQPALTKQMKKLEDYYGVELFRRSSTGIELTEEGSLLKDRVEPVLHNLEILRRELAKRTIQPLRLGSVPSFAAYVLPKLILDWKGRGLEARILLTGTSMVLGKELREGRIDAAIVEKSRIEGNQGYFVVQSYREPYFCLCLRDHPLARRDELTVEELLAEPLIMHPADCEVRAAIDSAFLARGAQPIVAEEAPFGESIVGFVTAGAGIAIVPKGIADQVGGGGLATRLIRDFPARELVLAAQSNFIGKILKDSVQKSGQG